MLSEAFELGTLNFLSIIALKVITSVAITFSLSLIRSQHGLELISRLGMSRIQTHAFNIAAAFYKGLTSMIHYNGARACIVYTENDFTDATVQVSP